MAEKTATVVVEKILQEVSVNGATPLTRDYITNQFALFQTNMQAMIATALSPTAMGASAAAAAGAEPPPPVLKTFLWANSRYDATQPTYHPIPMEFNFHNSNVTNMWLTWEYGNSGEKLGPYKNIVPRDMSDKKKNTMLTRVGAVMGHFVADARKQYPDFDTSDKSGKLKRMRDAYPSTVKSLYPHGTDSKRMTDGKLTFSTLYGQILEKKKKPNPGAPNQEGPQRSAGGGVNDGDENEGGETAPSGRGGGRGTTVGGRGGQGARGTTAGGRGGGQVEASYVSGTEYTI